MTAIAESQMIGKSKTGSRISACPDFKKKKKFKVLDFIFTAGNRGGKMTQISTIKALIQTPKSWKMSGEKMAVIFSELKSSGREGIWR